MRYQASELLTALAQIDSGLYPHARVREYAGDQRVVAALEAYLSAIYGSLEILAQLNRQFHPGLRNGFRKQSVKCALFDLKKHLWLRQFYDLRTECTHFGTIVPLISHRKLVIEFTAPSDLEEYERGKTYEIPFDDICRFTGGLFDLCDAWAEQELVDCDDSQSLPCYREGKVGEPLRLEEVSVGELKALLPRKAATSIATDSSPD